MLTILTHACWLLTIGGLLVFVCWALIAEGLDAWRGEDRDDGWLS